ncbi:MAG TPA: alpha-glucosidase C-terminal domain-containing protein, partial [Xanthomonadales bacterium]
EAGNPKRLEFFEKDPIDWQPHPIGDLYQRLFALKKQNTTLWNGQWGATMVRVWNTHPEKVFSFVRSNEQDKVFAVFNFSAEPQTVSFKDAPFEGRYREYFSGDEVEMKASTELTLPAWAYRVYVK